MRYSDYIEWSWSCTKCQNEGPYEKDDYNYPKGWKFNLVHGLICPICAKKFGIKTSDIEKESCINKHKDSDIWKNL